VNLSLTMPESRRSFRTVATLSPLFHTSICG
jgi:hypothetical protein